MDVLEGQVLSVATPTDLELRSLAGGQSEDAQVWTLTQFFFCFLFVKKSLICLEGKSMTPRRGNTILFRSSQQLPRLRLGPSKGFLS